MTQTQVSRSATPATANGLGMGATGNASVYTANYDDLFVATQAAAYPLADSRIVRLVPDSMGTRSGPPTSATTTERRSARTRGNDLTRCR